ncbi:major facilitator superfamily domain-containing protein [Xylaria bambusicola]|uniref:major facilitator superfamily domain-containing protein n=1 Tax=Xylaria bambusicola TaxID=326684 RepID=UPI0020082D0F|nr:major facilitator superfamily domain-containing protein [Xylaria bambusicola]KAI0505900.1 major facilitator superfamily domain-containing protein [Xylaria bambusicola]
MEGAGSRFHVANANNLSPAIAAYAVALGTFVLIACRLGEIFGNKQVFVGGLAWSAIWSLVTGTSFYSTRSLFIVGRAFQGIGASLTLPTGLSLLRAVARPTGIRKTVIFAIHASMSPIGLIVGAFGASGFVMLTWWPWAYWAFSIALVILATISHFTIRSSSNRRDLPPGARGITLELDLPGILSGGLSLGFFGFAWNQALVVGWQEVYIGVILSMSIILAALFVMIEACYAPKPLIPYSAISWEVFWILVAVGCGWSCFGIWIFYGWQFVETLQLITPVVTTTYFSPMVIVGCFCAAITPFILRPVGLHVMFCAALVSILIGAAIMAAMRIQQAYWEHLFISVLFMAWGVYTSVPVATRMIVNVVHKKHGGKAATLVCMASYYSIGMGLGIAGTVERSTIGGKLTVHSRLRGSRAVFWTSIGLAAFGVVVGLALAWVSWLSVRLAGGTRRAGRRLHAYEHREGVGGHH